MLATPGIRAPPRRIAALRLDLVDAEQGVRRRALLDVVDRIADCVASPRGPGTRVRLRDDAAPARASVSCAAPVCRLPRTRRASCCLISRWRRACRVRHTNALLNASDPRRWFSRPALMALRYRAELCRGKYTRYRASSRKLAAPGCRIWDTLRRARSGSARGCRKSCRADCV